MGPSAVLELDQFRVANGVVKNTDGRKPHVKQGKNHEVEGVF
jgi:hypothetical protein